jgi:hypothetical protein
MVFFEGKKALVACADYHYVITAWALDYIY